MLIRTLASLIVLLGIGATSVAAQELVYRPTNPAFGGSYLNYQWLLSSAQAQNAFEADAGSSFFDRDPLADFQNSLQRQILDQLSRELVTERFGNIDLSQPGTFDLGAYTVEVLPGVNGTTIRVFNPITGATTSVTIPNL
ncbi:curli assembly protein CsgF [Salisaeta longa]|uniref:curli assembly protein CsgF n=1 Tax=Salisaeta longa TaxID=503170 RepID=UPI0003B7A53F|nr:curli assembly protein CsgF [Salisaeta longa]